MFSPSQLYDKARNEFIKKEALAQVFSCEFYEISKNTFFYRTPPVAASEQWLLTLIPHNLTLLQPGVAILYPLKTSGGIKKQNWAVMG